MSDISDEAEAAFYAELARKHHDGTPTKDPNCPIASWEELLERANAAEASLAEAQTAHHVRILGLSHMMRDLTEQLRLANEENAKLRENQWPLGKLPNPCAGYSCDGVNVYGDEKSIRAVGDAFHYAGTVAQLQTTISQLEARNKELIAALKKANSLASAGLDGYGKRVYDSENEREIATVCQKAVAAAVHAEEKP